MLTKVGNKTIVSNISGLFLSNLHKCYVQYFEKSNAVFKQLLYWPRLQLKKSKYILIYND